ncbi:hypothetical protein DB345_08175 [Spartobacteria bacterium LR76]|nr:hypothetical protein DB345_08175 [Spartobacteria bacterium LR76]
MSDTSLTVLICSNRWSETFEFLINSLRNQQWQTADRVLIVNNGMSAEDLAALQVSLSSLPFPSNIIDEPIPGLGYARRTGFLSCATQWILLLDDDNSLSADAITAFRDFASAHEGIGGICPRITAIWDQDVADWIQDFGRRYCLSVTESGRFGPTFGETIWPPGTTCLLRPPGGGMLIRTSVAQTFVKEFGGRDDILKLARTKGSLGGCEDAIIYSFVGQMGYGAAYVPSIHIAHHLPVHRSKWSYLVKINNDMMISYGTYDRLVSPLFYSKLKRLKGWAINTLRNLTTQPCGPAPSYLKLVRAQGYLRGFLGL